MRKLYNSSKTVELTRSNSIFVKDWDGHDYCIHEDDHDLFQELLQNLYERDAEDEFNEKFRENMCGMAPAFFRKLHLF